MSHSHSVSFGIEILSDDQADCKGGKYPTILNSTASDSLPDFSKGALANLLLKLPLLFEPGMLAPTL